MFEGIRKTQLKWVERDHGGRSRRGEDLGGERSRGGRGGGSNHCPIRLELEEEKDAVSFGGHCGR